MSILKRLFTFAMVVFLLAASGAGAQEPDVPPPIAVTLTAEQARILGAFVPMIRGPSAMRD